MLSFLGVGAVLGGALVYESFTSTFQSWVFTRLNDHISFELTSGASLDTAYPRQGPYDWRLGYTRIPDFRARLETRGYQVTQSAIHSPALMKLISLGISPPYREKARPGLTIHDVRGLSLYNGRRDALLLKGVDEIPPLLGATLLFLENRELAEPYHLQSNPSFDWNRLAKGGFSYAASYLGFPLRVEGGSTLAVQLEKFHHSPGGRTSSPMEKLRQATAASLKAYRYGSDTGTRRSEILLDYLNSVPLAGVPGYGEVHGLGEGLHAWFGLRLEEVRRDLESPWLNPFKLRAFKHSLALLVALPAPASYLMSDRVALNERVDTYARLLAKGGIIDTEFQRALTRTPLTFLSSKPASEPAIHGAHDATNAIRTWLLRALGVRSFYELNRLDLAVETTVDSALQDEITGILRKLTDPQFVKANGLNAKGLLRGVDPAEVVYSLILYERTAKGNALRVQTDNLDEAFDINSDAKLELGSTAKLRAVTHYLELVASLYDVYAPLDIEGRIRNAKAARDAITRWTAETLAREPGLELEAVLDLALDRRYSTTPHTFFTGGGGHTFRNFDSSENGKKFSVRKALKLSNNLVFVRLMRDLVRYHEARLPYDTKVLLSDYVHPERQRLLREIVRERSASDLRYAYAQFEGLSQGEIIERLLRSRLKSLRHLTILFFAWEQGTHRRALGTWLTRWADEEVTPEQIASLWQAYANPRLNLADYGYLLSRDPLQIYVAGELMADPSASWRKILAGSEYAVDVSSRWLFQKRNRRAQNSRLRIRFERDAFARMTPYWRRLGFPFEKLVPSYGTVLGSSADSPAALAELMGVIVNDGLRRPAMIVSAVHFGQGTPYEMLMTPKVARDVPVMQPAVARVLKRVLAQVVADGTAKRISGVFEDGDGTQAQVGGKTGSGDNRRKRYNRWGEIKSAHAVNRTATLVFYIGERYFGVVTAFVRGRKADEYRFTSALPQTVLKLLAPAINRHMRAGIYSIAALDDRDVLISTLSDAVPSSLLGSVNN